MRAIGALAIVALLTFTAPPARADWPTARGNAGRTGNVDGQPGPREPKVRWAYKAQEHFIASPVPAAKALYVSGLGAFNTAAFHALALDGDAPQRTLWSKTSPFVRLPTVSSPAVAEGVLVFGDGMHQTDGATLYCLHAETGRPLWQYALPGKLVHLEGAPAILDGKVYIGGGEAGVLCVDLRKATLDGKELDLAALRFLMDRRWADLEAKYAQDKLKDADLAVPPGEDALPKPTPKLLWQKGAGKWHVDAPVDVGGDRVLFGSAFVEEDKVGKRALVCLNAVDGATVWETPLKINPWAGPTIAGDLAIVGCSSIRYDRKLIKGAAGEVVAVSLENGQVKWRKDLPGGVLASVALRDDLAVFTATDGKLRALEAATGNVRWEYDAKAPFFAGAALTGGIAYAADLKGVLHAVRLADGKAEWKLDVVADPAVRAPGMVFGSPVVHGGEIFLATNNLEGEVADAPSVVVCLSDRSAGAGGPPKGQIAIDHKAGTVTVPCRVAPRKLPNLREIYPLEVVATHPAPAGQKSHETLVVFDARPSDIHKALESLGLKPGKPARGEGARAAGPTVEMSLMLPGFDGKPRPVPLERMMVDRRTGKPMPPLKWHFTGSTTRQPDPDKPERVYAADLTGTLISIFPVTDETVFQTNMTMREEPLVKLDSNKSLLPEEGTAVELVIRVRPGSGKPG